MRKLLCPSCGTDPSFLEDGTVMCSCGKIIVYSTSQTPLKQRMIMWNNAVIAELKKMQEEEAPAEEPTKTPIAEPKKAQKKKKKTAEPKIVVNGEEEEENPIGWLEKLINNRGK